MTSPNLCARLLPRTVCTITCPRKSELLRPWLKCAQRTVPCCLRLSWGRGNLPRLQSSTVTEFSFHYSRSRRARFRRAHARGRASLPSILHLLCTMAPSLLDKQFTTMVQDLEALPFLQVLTALVFPLQDLPTARSTTRSTMALRQIDHCGSPAESVHFRSPAHSWSDHHNHTAAHSQ